MSCSKTETKESGTLEAFIRSLVTMTGSKNLDGFDLLIEREDTCK
jgi:hypothetical protein